MRYQPPQNENSQTHKGSSDGFSQKLSKQRNQSVARNLHALSYSKKETIRQQKINGKQQIVETDIHFVHSIEEIVKLSESIIEDIIKFSKSTLSEQECEEIHYKSKVHSAANIINKNSGIIQKDVLKDQSLAALQCKCGCERFEGQLFSWAQSPQNLNILGPGVILFFFYLKAIILFLLVLFLIYGLFALATNLMGQNDNSAYLQGCATAYCQAVLQMSDSNKANPLKNEKIQDYLGVIGMVVWSILLKLLRYYGGQKNNWVDAELSSASDFALMISNLPAGTYNQNHLISQLLRIQAKIRNTKKEQKAKTHHNFLSSLFTNISNYFVLEEEESLLDEADLEKEHLFRLSSVQIIYNMQFTRNAIEKLLDFCVEAHEMIEHREGKYLVNDLHSYTKLKNEIVQTYQTVKDLRKKFLHDHQFRQSLSTHSCIIEFESQGDKDQILKYFGVSKASFFTKLKNKILRNMTTPDKSTQFQGNILTIERSPEPSDILWQNCEQQQSLIRICLIYLASFLIAVLSNAILAVFQYLEIVGINDSSASEQEGVSVTAITLTIVVLMQVINKLIWYSLTQMINLEKNHTHTDAIISQMTKSSVMILINIIVLPIVVYQILEQDFYGINGISGIVFNYHFSAILINLNLKLLDPLNSLFRACLNVKAIRNYIIQRAHKNLTIREGSEKIFTTKINEMYEYPEFDIGQCYVYIICNVLQAAFFCPLQPVLLFFVLIECLYFYWICKINLFRRSKIPEMTDLIVFEIAVNMLLLLPVFYGLGGIFISYTTHQINNDRPFIFASYTVAIVIGILFFMDPYGVCRKVITKIASKCQCFNFEEQLPKSQSSLGGKKGSKIEKKEAEKTKRIQNYYHKSNSLSLFGFQKILKGNSELHNIEEEIKQFCQGFIKKNIHYDECLQESQDDVELQLEQQIPPIGSIQQIELTYQNHQL